MLPRLRFEPLFTWPVGRQGSFPQSMKLLKPRSFPVHTSPRSFSGWRRPVLSGHFADRAVESSWANLRKRSRCGLWCVQPTARQRLTGAPSESAVVRPLTRAPSTADGRLFERISRSCWKGPPSLRCCVSWNRLRARNNPSINVRFEGPIPSPAAKLLVKGRIGHEISLDPKNRPLGGHNMRVLGHSGGDASPSAGGLLSAELLDVPHGRRRPSDRS